MDRADLKAVDVAKDAFETADYITGVLTGGVEAPRKLLKARVSKEGVEIDYTYPETCGLSDARYHDTRAGKTFTDVFSYVGGKLAVNGNTDIFGINGWNDPDINKMASDFYARNGLVAVAA